MANNLENVIDIGAGNAVFGLALKKQKNEVIYDVVEPNIQVQDKYGDWVNNSYTDINQIKRKSYDLVILNQVLEHIPDPINFLKSISKFIKNGGYLYIDVPFQDYLFKKSIEPHLIFLNHKSISFLMQNVGLKMVF
jgi:2-polyprenyl-3-methyl-5-hydroxy-6-metoxy-1,4-benzoquinol methylase